MNLFVLGMVHIIDGWIDGMVFLDRLSVFIAYRRSNKSLTMNRFLYSNPLSPLYYPY
jgi:hypothetical protein